MNENLTPSGAPGAEKAQPKPPAEEPVIDAELEAVARLLLRAGQAVEVPADFNGRLENQLRQRALAARKGPEVGYRLFGRPVSRLGMMLAGAATMALILLLAPLLLPALTPHINPPFVTPTGQAVAANPASPHTGPTQPVLASPSAPSPTQVIPAPGIQPLLTFFGSSAQAQTDAGGIFGKAQLTLSQNLPASPKAVTIYEQHAEPAITPALAKAQAAKLGIQGEVYQSPSEAGGVIYHVTDGLQEVWFMQDTRHFTYVADMHNSMISRPSTLPLEKRAQAAEVFLKKAGLLDFDFRVDEPLSQGRKVVFDRLFNGVPLLQTDTYNPYISVEVNDAGKVDIAMVGLNPMQPLGDYPIRSAEDAWRIVLGDPNDKRVQYTLTDPAVNLPQIMASWNRSYPDGPRVDITFYPNVLPSAEPGGQPWVTLGPFTLRGDLSSLLDAYNGPQELSAEQKQMIASGEVSEKQAIGWSRFLHVWGQATTTQNGVRYLQVEGWERSPMPDDYFFGTLSEENGSRLFSAEDGQKWSLAAYRSANPRDTPAPATL